jgi:hypothetical protein
VKEMSKKEVKEMRWCIFFAGVLVGMALGFWGLLYALSDFVLLVDKPKLMAFLLLVPGLWGLLSWIGIRVCKPRAARLYAMFTVPISIICFGMLAWLWLVLKVKTIEFFDLGIEVPTYIPISAFLGVLVYSTRSILTHFGDLVDSLAYKKTLMAVAQRILLAPYIAIFAIVVLFRPITDRLFTLLPGIDKKILELFLAFFTGIYVKQVLGVLDALGRKIMTQALKKKLQWQEKPIELVWKLDMSPDLADRLLHSKKAKVSSVKDLEGLKQLCKQDIEKVAEEIRLDEQQLQKWIEMASIYNKKLNEMDSKLRLKDTLKEKLEMAKIASLWLLAKMEKKKLAEELEIDESEAEELINEAKKFVEGPSNPFHKWFACFRRMLGGI